MALLGDKPLLSIPGCNSLLRTGCRCLQNTLNSLLDLQEQTFSLSPEARGEHSHQTPHTPPGGNTLTRPPTHLQGGTLTRPPTHLQGEHSPDPPHTSRGPGNTPQHTSHTHTPEEGTDHSARVQRSVQTLPLQTMSPLFVVFPVLHRNLPPHQWQGELASH